MYDFLKFRDAAFKNKYEIAFETEKKRMTYAELYDKVNAIYNSLYNMGVEGSAVVALSDPIKASIAALALSKRGMKRIFTNSKVSKTELSILVKKHSPSVIFAEGSELSRLFECLEQTGVKTAVFTGKSEQIFPSQFDFDQLVVLGDYTLVKEYESTNKIVFSDNTLVTLKPSCYDSLKQGVCVDVPVYCKLSAKVISEILYRGGRCVFFDETNAKKLKKRKAQFVVTDTNNIENYKGFKGQIFGVDIGIRKIGDSFFDGDKISGYISKISGLDVRVIYNGAVICVSVMLSEKDDLNNPKTNKSVQIAKQCALDVLYPFNSKKTFAVKQKQ